MIQPTCSKRLQMTHPKLKSALYDTETENGIVFSMYPPEQFITFLTHKSPNRNEKTHKDIVYTYPNSENTLLSKAESELKQSNRNNYSIRPV